MAVTLTLKQIDWDSDRNKNAGDTYFLSHSLFPIAWDISLEVVAQNVRSRPSDGQGSAAPATGNGSSSRCKKEKATITEAGSSGRIACPDGNCDFQPTPAWYLSLKFFESLTIADADGHIDKFQAGSRLFQTIPFVTYSNPCPGSHCLFVIMPTTKTYTLTFTSRAGEPIHIDLVKGVGNRCPDVASRYLDLLLPKGSAAKLTITAQGVEDLSYDHEGDGNFSTMVKPTVRVIAPGGVGHCGTYRQVQYGDTGRCHHAGYTHGGG